MVYIIRRSKKKNIKKELDFYLIRYILYIFLFLE